MLGLWGKNSIVKICTWKCVGLYFENKTTERIGLFYCCCALVEYRHSAKLRLCSTYVSNFKRYLFGQKVTLYKLTAGHIKVPQSSE